MTTEPKISKVVREIEMSYDEGREFRVTGSVYYSMHPTIEGAALGVATGSNHARRLIELLDCPEYYREHVDCGRFFRCWGAPMISMVLIDMDIIRRDYHLEPIFL